MAPDRSLQNLTGRSMLGTSSSVEARRMPAANRDPGHGPCRKGAGLCPFFQSVKEQVMNWDRVEGNWLQLKGKVKEQWGKLTDDQIDEVAGKRDQLVGLVQEKYGIERDKAERDVDSWVSKLN
jgi:uncharacterized protein YjbJ (UPF0337 family)